MRKLSKKAKRLIIDFSSAAADLTNKAIRPNFIQFGEARTALMDYIAELESARRWIPVSERLPQNGMRVWFYNSFTKNIHKGWFYCDEWVSEIGVFYNGDKIKRITHWMPQPEPPNDTQTDTFVYGKESEE